MGQHVLIVDDTPSTRRVLMRSIRGLADESTASSATGVGVTAHRSAERPTFDLALADLPRPDQAALRLIESITRT